MFVTHTIAGLAAVYTAMHDPLKQHRIRLCGRAHDTSTPASVCCLPQMGERPAPLPDSLHNSPLPSACCNSVLTASIVSLSYRVNSTPDKA